MKVSILTLSSVLMKICQIPHVIFQTTSHFFFKFCMTPQCHELQLLCTFLGQTLYTLHKKDQSKCKFFRLLSARIKIHQIFVIFETKNRFFFKFCTTLQYHETVESLKFCTLVGYFCKNHITFQLKKCRRLFSHDIEERCKY